jgi:hypothetical protein
VIHHQRKQRISLAFGMNTSSASEMRMENVVVRSAAMELETLERVDLNSGGRSAIGSMDHGGL